MDELTEAELQAAQKEVDRDLDEQIKLWSDALLKELEEKGPPKDV